MKTPWWRFWDPASGMPGMLTYVCAMISSYALAYLAVWTWR